MNLNIGDVIQNDNGKTYTILDRKGPDCLLSYDTERGPHYMIAWRIQQEENGLITWQQGHYYMENKEAAMNSMAQREAERNRKTDRLFFRQR